MTKEEARVAVMGAISMALKDSTLQQGFEIICKENEDLENRNKVLKSQLIKAKEIIEELLSSCFGYNSKTVNYEVKVKAEQFLKEE